MTNAELNRDIKRLGRRVEQLRNNCNDSEAERNKFYAAIENGGEINKEFNRLYRADREFSACNRTSILILMRINQLYRYEAFHHFGIQIELSKLV
jgi:predicted nucleotidyltransferase